MKDEDEKKRDALENVLVPHTMDQNRELLTCSGFSRQEIFYKWYNFCGWLAVK